MAGLQSNMLRSIEHRFFLGHMVVPKKFLDLIDVITRIFADTTDPGGIDCEYFNGTDYKFSKEEKFESLWAVPLTIATAIVGK